MSQDKIDALLRELVRRADASTSVLVPSSQEIASDLRRRQARRARRRRSVFVGTAGAAAVTIAIASGSRSSGHPPRSQPRVTVATSMMPPPESNSGTPPAGCSDPTGGGPVCLPSVSVSIAVVDVDGQAVPDADVTVRTDGGSWIDLGRTDADGLLFTGLLPSGAGELRAAAAIEVDGRCAEALVGTWASSDLASRTAFELVVRRVDDAPQSC